MRSILTIKNPLAYVDESLKKVERVSLADSRTHQGFSWEKLPKNRASGIV